MIAWMIALLACDTAPLCERPADPLVTVGTDTLACADAETAERYVVRLSGRELSPGDRQLAYIGVRERFERDPAGTRAWLQEMTAIGATVELKTDMPGAALRSQAVWRAISGQGPIREGDGTLWNLQKRALSVWARDDEEQLALTETDIEGWIRYVSLCREAQGTTPLRLSIADRVTTYEMMVDVFGSSPREQQVAMASLGAYWPEIRHRWAIASYEDQQAWIAAAPLPPPMEASSLGYAEEVVRGDLTRHAKTLQGHLGPFTLGFGERAFTAEGAP